MGLSHIPRQHLPSPWEIPAKRLPSPRLRLLHPLVHEALKQGHIGLPIEEDREVHQWLETGHHLRSKKTTQMEGVKGLKHGSTMGYTLGKTSTI